MFDKTAFENKLKVLKISKKRLAFMIGVDDSTLYRKINGISDFYNAEMQIIKKALKLTKKEFETIFFAEKLTDTQDITHK